LKAKEEAREKVKREEAKKALKGKRSTKRRGRR